MSNSNHPLAMSIQLVITKEKRLAIELELVMEDGTVINRTISANEKLTIHFDQLVNELLPPVLRT